MRKPATCDGTGFVVTNPRWPRGTKPYRVLCDGCAKCGRGDPQDWPRS